MTQRLYKRVDADHDVRLSVNDVGGLPAVRGEARLVNLSLSGVCLTGIAWQDGKSRLDPDTLIDLHLPLPDWVGVDVQVRPVRVRFDGLGVELGAMIVSPPMRLSEVIEKLDQPVSPGA